MFEYIELTYTKHFTTGCWCLLLLTCIPHTPSPFSKIFAFVSPERTAILADDVPTGLQVAVRASRSAAAATFAASHAATGVNVPAAEPNIGSEQLPTQLRISRQEWLRRRKAVKESSCPTNCTWHGTCHEELGRCDCPRHRDGLNCGYKLSEPSLEKRCKNQGYDSIKECMNKEQSCINACNHRGVCVGGFCHCAPGHFGSDCSLSLGPDGKPVLLAGTGYQTRSKRPWVYVYELPPHLAVWYNFRRLDRLLHVYIWQRLLSSGARVADGDVADYFYIPVRQRSYADSWVLQEAIHYIQSQHPWWNRTGGHRHVVIHTGDWGLGEVAEPVQQMGWNMSWLTHWGLSQDRSEIKRWSLAFRPERDVVIPVYISPGHFVRFGIIRSPLHRAAAARAPPRNASTLFFAGRICHNPKLPTPQTFPRCGDDTETWYGGGIREKFFVSHWNRSRFHVVRSEPRYGYYMSRSAFCLAPPGAGHGQRQIQALFMGCGPVVIADRVAEPFEPALNWEDWGLRIPEVDIPRAHELLADVAPEQLVEKQSRMYCAAQHMLYSTITGAVLGEDGRYDAFETMLEVLRVRAAHPDAPQEDFKRLDPDFAAFMDCRRPPGFQWLNGTVERRTTAPVQRPVMEEEGKTGDANVGGGGGNGKRGISPAVEAFAVLGHELSRSASDPRSETLVLRAGGMQAGGLEEEEGEEQEDGGEEEGYGSKGVAAGGELGSEVALAGARSPGPASPSPFPNSSFRSPPSPQAAAWVPGLCSHAARDMRSRERGCYHFLRGGGYIGVPGGAVCAKGFKTRLEACPRLWG